MNIVTLHPTGRVTFGRVRNSYKLHKLPLCSKHQRMRDESIGVIGAARFAEWIGKPLSMDLTSVSISEKTLEPLPRGKRGFKGMTSRGRQLVANAATVLQEQYGKGKLSFWTLTVPDECLTHSLISDWSRIVELVRKKLLYHLGKAELPKLFVGVTEVQQKRWESSARALPLHLHILFVTAKRDYQPLIGKKLLAKIWRDALRTVGGRETEAQYASRAEFIKKSAARYLSKYMSKGGMALDWVPRNQVPSSWYFMSAGLRLAVKKSIVKASGLWVGEMFEFVRSESELFRWSHAIFLPSGAYGQIMVGWVAECLDNLTHKLLKDMIEGMRDNWNQELSFAF